MGIDQNACAKCGASLLAGDRFCPACGTARASDPPTAPPAPESSPPSKPGLQWKWVFAGAFAIVGLQFAFGVAIGVVLGSTGREDAPAWLVALGAFASFLVGAAIVAYRSPGLTIREPAIGAALAVGAIALLSGKGSETIGALVVSYVLALLGAKLGERLQRGREVA